MLSLLERFENVVFTFLKQIDQNAFDDIEEIGFHITICNCEKYFLDHFSMAPHGRFIAKETQKLFEYTVTLSIVSIVIKFDVLRNFSKFLAGSKSS